MGEFYTKVAGITYGNRQIYARNCTVGQMLALIREKSNPYDPNAVAIYSGSNQLGYISKEVAAQIAPQMDAGVRYTCTVASVTGGENGRFYGVNIKIAWNIN